MKKTKHSKILIFSIALMLSIVLLIVSLYIKNYTGLFGTPKYIYLNGTGIYLANDVGYRGYVRSDELLDVYVYSKDELSKCEKKIGYCSNIIEMKFDLENECTENVDFLKNRYNLQKLYYYGKSNDWREIAGCKNAEVVGILLSDFEDTGLLSGFDKVEDLRIISDKPVNCEGLDTMISLKLFVLSSPEMDLKKILKVPKVKTLSLRDAKKIYNPDFSEYPETLDTLSIYGSCIEKSLLESILKTEPLESLTFVECTIDMSEQEFESFLQKFRESGIELTVKNNTFTK